MKLVAVKWEDIVVQNGWADLEELKDLLPHEVTSIGFVIYQDDDRIILVHGLSATQGNPASVIPMGCVLSITPFAGDPSIYDVSAPRT